MKLKTKIQAWALTGLAAVTVFMSLSTMLLSGGTAFAADQSASIVSGDSSIKCVGSMFGQLINSQTAINNVGLVTRDGGGNAAAGTVNTFANGGSQGQIGGADGADAQVWKDIDTGKNTLEINFKGADGHSNADNACGQSLVLFRQVSPADGNLTKFYGVWYSGQGQLANEKYWAVKGYVDVTAKTLSLTLPAPSNFNGNVTLTIPDSMKSYFTASTGGGGTGGTTGQTLAACAAQYNDDSNGRMSACIQNKSATFIDSAHIMFDGETYTATNWPGTEGSFALDSSSKNTALQKLSPVISFSTDGHDKNHIDMNVDDNTKGEDLGNLKNAITTGGTINATYKINNVTLDGKLPLNKTGLQRWATYYPKSKTITLNYKTAGSEESPYFGNYTVGATKDVYNLTSGGFSGCGTAKPYFQITDGTDLSTSSAQYTGAAQATWNVMANNQACDPTSIPITITIAAADAVSPVDSNQTDTSGDAPEINCSVQFYNPLSWFLCPLATALETVVTQLDNEINNFLNITPGNADGYNGTANCGTKGNVDKWCGYYNAWGVVKNIALGLMVVFALIAVISQALGFEFVDAYTLRKVLPRLLVAAIGITLSWPLMMLFIQITDDLGVGVRQLIYAPFQDYKVALGGGSQFILTFFVGGGAIVALGFAGLLSFVATAALAVAIAFLVLIIRQMVIVLLVIIAPIAIVSYILPNTQKLWKFWSDSFMKGLMMFPLISAFIAIGRVFAAVNTNNTGAINQIIAFTAYFAPYFLIPLTFRLAGGAIGTLGGFVNDRGRGAFDRLKKQRQGIMADRFKRAQSQSLWDNSSKIGKRANTLASWATDPVSNAAYYGRNVPGLKKRGNKIASGLEHMRVEQTGKLFEEVNKITGANDKALRALSGMHYGFSGDVREAMQREGLYGKAPQSLSDFQKMGSILEQYGQGTEKIGGGVLKANAGRLATLYQDPEFGKASVAGAGIMGLAAHGFADSRDLSNAANYLAGGTFQTNMGDKLDSEGNVMYDDSGNAIQADNGNFSGGHDSEAGFALGVIGQAQQLGARSRPEAKNGYGVMYAGNGRFVDGMSAEGGRMGAVLDTFSSHDLASAKGGAIKAVRKEIKNRLSLKGSSNPADVAKFQAMKDNLFSWAGPYSQASSDVKVEAIKIIRENGLEAEFNSFARRERDPETMGAGGAGGDGDGVV